MKKRTFHGNWIVVSSNKDDDTDKKLQYLFECKWIIILDQ